MLRFSRCALFCLLFAWGCARSTDSDTGSSSSQPVAGNKGGASTGGSAGKSGGSGGSTASSSAASSCVPVISNLVTGNKWVCDMNTDLKIQGSFYSFGDGSSCTTTSDFCSAAGGCCMAGATVVDSTYAKWGCGLGLELNASGGTSSVKSVYAGPVSCFDITLTGNSGGNVVRIGFTQAANTTGKVSPFVQLEPFTNGAQKKICLTDAECPDWAVTAGTCSKTVGTAGTPYDLQIQVPGGDKAGSFNVCVTKIVPIMGGSVNTGTTTSTTTGSSCSSSTGQGTFTSQYESNHVTCNSKDYVIQNNAWGSSAGQTITYGPGTKFKVTKQNGTGSNGAPASFPSIFIGGNNGRSTTGSGLPKGVSALSTVPTSLTWASNGASGAYNTAYDVWFSSSSSGEPASTRSPTGGFLMVWFYKPNGKQPIGTIQATSTIAGNNWNVWYGINTGVTPNVPCVSYVAQQSINSLTFDLNAFIKDAVDLGYVKTSWGLTNVFAGFEIWDGGTGLEIKDFSVTVN